MALSPRPPVHLRGVERALAGYLALTSILALVRWGTAAEAAWVLALNGLILGLIALLIRPVPGRWQGGLRECFPFLILPALYSQIDFLNPVGATAVHDAIVQGWEHALFSSQVSRDWWRSSPSHFWSTVFHLAYLAFYPIVVAPTILFLLRGDGAAARRSVLWVISSFLCCYVAFLLFPVAGPYYEFPWPDQRLIDNPAARLVYATLSQGSSYGAAFPSSHVAAALAATAAGRMGSARLGVALAVPTVLLTVGVVYCQMHYAVDAIAGVLMGGIIVAAGLHSERKSLPPSVALGRKGGRKTG